MLLFFYTHLWLLSVTAVRGLIRC